MASVPTKPTVVQDPAAVRQPIRQAQADGKSVGVVMTMGALHAGHLSLVQASNRECDLTYVTLFVNPTQFLPGEDYKKYPRDLDNDLELLAEYNVEAVFAPDADSLYVPDHSTFVEPPRVAESWEGRCRPGHFRGVTTIVLKLMHILPADIAYFGRKDYQQLMVIRTMVSELDVPTIVRGCAIVRDSDGLALSSRNRYLSDGQRRQALAIPRSLDIAAEMLSAGETTATQIAARIRRELDDAGITRIDYVAVVDPETLEEVRTAEADTVAMTAAYVGDTRLIDNRILGDTQRTIDG